MGKSSYKVNLASPKDGELFFIGISSASGVAILSSQLNRYLNIELSFYSKLMALNNETVYDNLPIFTTFEPKENELDTSSDTDVFDFKLPQRIEITKFLLIQSRGDKSSLFPKITQLDFLLISNYSLSKFYPLIQSIPEVTMPFELKKEHLGKRFDYFRKLFYS